MTDISKVTPKEEEGENLEEYFKFDKIENITGMPLCEDSPPPALASIFDLKTNSKKKYIRIIFLLGILICILILIIIIVSISKKENKKIICESGYFLPEDSNSKKCEKCSLDNCEKCFGMIKVNICQECKQNFFLLLKKKQLVYVI